MIYHKTAAAACGRHAAAGKKCNIAVCCSGSDVLQCVAVCCSGRDVLQCVAVCCSVLQCVAVAAMYRSVWQCVAVCCSGRHVVHFLQWLRRIAVCCSGCDATAVSLLLVLLQTITCKADF